MSPPPPPPPPPFFFFFFFAARRESPRRNVCFLCRVHAQAAKGSVMQILYSRCCGIDVHKNSVTACVLVYAQRQRTGSAPEGVSGPISKRSSNLPSLASGPKGDSRGAWNPPGVYWKPLWQALEGQLRTGPRQSFSGKDHAGKEDRRPPTVNGWPSYWRTA